MYVQYMLYIYVYNHRTCERGNGAFKQQDHQEALKHYSRAVVLASSPPPSVKALESERATALSNRALVYLKLQTDVPQAYQSALEDADAALELEPLNAKAHYRRAQALLHTSTYAVPVGTYAVP